MLVVQWSLSLMRKPTRVYGISPIKLFVSLFSIFQFDRDHYISPG